MKIDFAPLEGVADRIYRELHAKFFGGVDRYYLPFYSPTKDHLIPPRDARELAPEPDFTVVPQLLTKNAEDFLWAAGELRGLGYRVVNLNLGCPSATVTAKGKGSGMLRDPDELERFLDRIFEGTPIPVSIKTRIGYDRMEEWEELLSLFARYPIAELIIHPRTRGEWYRGEVHAEAFERAAGCCSFPVTFNGNLFSSGDLERFAKEHPEAERVMIGRGLVMDPSLALRVKGVLSDAERRERLRAFERELGEGYRRKFEWERSTLFRRKEIWGYLIHSFADETGKYQKRLHKATTLAAFDEAVAAIFGDLALT